MTPPWEGNTFTGPPSSMGTPAWEADRTHFRVSLLLQVEQEKQFTHQALLRADTTVMGRWAGV